jgi:tripartite-type tricarboxylate transporter receptor subunit TctC
MNRSISLLALAAGCALSQVAMGQEYPTKPIRMIVPWAAGGSTDSIGRILAQKLSEALGQQILVDNRPGATGTIGHAMVAKSPADGYTLLMGSNSTFAIAPHLYKNLAYDNEKGFAPVSLVAVSPQALSLHPSVPVKDVKGFIALAKSRPGEIVFSTAGAGATSHMAAELLMAMTGTTMTHVPYKGGAPSAQAVLGGETMMTFMDVITCLPFARSGKLRAIGVGTLKRSAMMPELPTLDESGLKGYDSATSFALFTPAVTPRNVVNRLHREVVSALADAQVKERLIAQGIETVGSTPEAFAAYNKTESEKWARVVRERNIKVQ